MSAREDAIKPTSRHSGRTATLILATLAGISLGIVAALVNAPPSLALFEARVPWPGGAPAAGEWPAPPNAGESAEVAMVGERFELRVRAPRLPQARRLAQALAHRRAAQVPALGESHATLLARWRARVLPAPPPPLAQLAECASWLAADASRRIELAAALPAPYAAAFPAGAPATEVEAVPEVLAAESAVLSAVRAADPGACRRALLALATAEDAWLARGVPSAAAPAAVRGAVWRRVQLVRADSLGALAARTLEDQPESQRELVTAGAAGRVVSLDAALADPYAALSANAALPPIETRPLPGPWGALVGFGGGFGGLAALLAAGAGLSMRRVPRRAGAPLFVPARDPAAPLPWLHVVAGPSPSAVVRAALELSAHALARRERVLVIDAGTRLRLHDRLGREARWGLMECLQGDMPVLGLVQYGGRAGFYLLAHGHADAARAWAGLGRCLDDSRLHFGRIIVAIDGGTPGAFGDALSGRPLEGWWGAPVETVPMAAAELSARMGIAFSGIDLSFVPDVSLEVLGERVASLAALLPAPPAPLPEIPAEPVAIRSDPVPYEPVVLDCDLQVRQRLRFLAWMRRVQSESRQAEARTAPR
jgi:hypothetical protein